jgi:hypothetical protein
MRGDGQDHGPRIPIPGGAGATIYEALSRMAMHCGECGITIKKERVAGGGYVYVIGTNEPPARPVRSINHG